MNKNYFIVAEEGDLVGTGIGTVDRPFVISEGFKGVVEASVWRSGKEAAANALGVIHCREFYLIDEVAERFRVFASAFAPEQYLTDLGDLQTADGVWDVPTTKRVLKNYDLCFNSGFEAIFVVNHGAGGHFSFWVNGTQLRCVLTNPRIDILINDEVVDTVSLGNDALIEGAAFLAIRVDLVFNFNTNLSEFRIYTGGVVSGYDPEDVDGLDPRDIEFTLLTTFATGSNVLNVNKELAFSGQDATLERAFINEIRYSLVTQFLTGFAGQNKIVPDLPINNVRGSARGTESSQSRPTGIAADPNFNKTNTDKMDAFAQTARNVQIASTGHVADFRESIAGQIEMRSFGRIHPLIKFAQNVVGDFKQSRNGFWVNSLGQRVPNIASLVLDKQIVISRGDVINNTHFMFFNTVYK